MSTYYKMLVVSISLVEFILVRFFFVVLSSCCFRAFVLILENLCSYYYLLDCPLSLPTSLITTLFLRNKHKNKDNNNNNNAIMLLPSSSSSATLLLILLGHFTFLTNAQSQVTCMPGTSSNSLEACRNRFEHACCPGRFCFQSSPGVYEVCVNSGKPSYHHDQHTERAVRG